MSSISEIMWDAFDVMSEKLSHKSLIVECEKNLREDKINAILDNKEFKYKSSRHNPNHGMTSDTGPR